MKTLIEIKIDRLKAQAACPCCGESRKHFSTAATGAGDDYTVNPDDLATAAYDCGAEFNVDEDGHFITRIPCEEPSRKEASLMESDAESMFEDEEDAA